MQGKYIKDKHEEEC